MISSARRRIYFFAQLGTALALASPAYAQQLSDSDAAGSGIGDIVVTAQRTAGTVQTTPIAITAADAAMLKDRQINDVRDIASIVPGLVIQPVTSVANAARIVLRGAGQETSGILYDPGVAIYVDNVYEPRINGNVFDFFDIERLEVLRGPQGTLYGRNSSGGAIKIVTRTPSTSDSAFAGDAAYGSFNSFALRTYSSVPLVEGKVAASVSTVYKKREGYIKSDVYDGGNVGDIDLFAARGKLYFTPTDSFSVELAADYTRDRSDSGVGVPITVRPGVTNPNATPNRNLYRTEFRGVQRAPLDSYGGSINARWKLADRLTLVSITGYRHLSLEQIAPLWQWTNTTENSSSYEAHNRNWSEELNLEYQGGSVTAVAGLYYFNEKGRLGRPLPGTPGDLYGTERYLTRKTEAMAAFGEVNVEVLDGLKLIGGIRATREKAHFSQLYPTVYNVRQYANDTFDAVTPKFGVNWQASRDAMFYASYTKGFKSGGFNEITPSIRNVATGERFVPELYRPETVQSYEAGVKFTTADRKFRLNLSVYQADYKDLQLPALLPGTAVSTTRNATSARIRGIEIEPLWKLSRALEIYGALSFSDGKYTGPYTCSNGAGFFVDCSGKKIKGVIPIQVTYGFALTPQLPIPGEVRITGDWRYTSDYFNNVSNDLKITQAQELSLFNAAVKWTSEDEHWSVALEGRNLANKSYYLAALQLASPTAPAVTVYPGEPRAVNLRVGWNF